MYRKIATYTGEKPIAELAGAPPPVLLVRNNIALSGISNKLIVYARVSLATETFSRAQCRSAAALSPLATQVMKRSGAILKKGDISPKVCKTSPARPEVYQTLLASISVLVTPSVSKSLPRPVSNLEYNHACGDERTHRDILSPWHCEGRLQQRKPTGFRKTPTLWLEKLYRDAGISNA
jgi:hypothetical protein